MAETENLNFEVDGISFYVLWKSPISGCLMRSIDHTGLHQTCLDLFSALYDGSNNYELPKNIAIAKAPVIARHLIDKQIAEELQYMEKLFTNEEFRLQYKVYKTFLIENTPVVWASHMGYIFIKTYEWKYIGWAKTQEETIEIVKQNCKLKVVEISPNLKVVGCNVIELSDLIEQSKISIEDESRNKYWAYLYEFLKHFFPANKEMASLSNVDLNNTAFYDELASDYFTKNEYEYDCLCIPFLDNSNIVGNFYMFFEQLPEDFQENHKVLTGFEWNKIYNEEIAMTLAIPVSTKYQHLFDFNPEIGEKYWLNKQEFIDLYTKNSKIKEKYYYTSFFNWSFFDGTIYPLSYCITIDYTLLDYLKSKDNKCEENSDSIELSENEQKVDSGCQSVLEKWALKNPNDKIRELSVINLTNQDVIADIAKNDKNKEVRIAAVTLLSSQELLANIAINDREVDVRIAATEKLTDQNVLTSIAKDFGEKDDVREAALEKLTDQNVIAEIAKKDYDKCVRNAATKMLNDQEALGIIAMNDKFYSIQSSAIKRITDQAILANIAKNAKDWEVRLASVKKITDKNILSDIIKNDIDDRVRAGASEILKSLNK